MEPTPDPSQAGAGLLSRISNGIERFAERHWSRAVEFFEGRAVDLILRRLEGNIEGYELRTPNNMANLLTAVQPADVILVEGRRKLSFVIQKVTSSPWSHAMLYVGNGQVIEAEDHGVVLSPIMKYAEHNIRLCTPRFIDAADRAKVVALAKESLGRSYDMTNIRNLLLAYFAAPRGREEFLGNLEEVQEMCSALIARAFDTVGYAVLPGRDPTQIMPRDFDLSPNFAIVKFNRMPPRVAIGASGDTAERNPSP